MIEYTPELYVQFLIDEDLNPEQFLLLRLLMERKMSVLYKYVDQKGGFRRESIDNLMDRGIIETDPDNLINLQPDRMRVTEEFRSKLFNRHPEEMFKEFWDRYPNFLFISSKRMPTKATNKEELGERYQEMVKHNVPLHNSIIEALEFGKKLGVINSGILKFYQSYGWEAILDEKRKGGDEDVGELPSEQLL